MNVAFKMNFIFVGCQSSKPKLIIKEQILRVQCTEWFSCVLDNVSLLTVLANLIFVVITGCA